jgi:hypothetical protein
MQLSPSPPYYCGPTRLAPSYDFSNLAQIPDMATDIEILTIGVSQL